MLHFPTIYNVRGCLSLPFECTHVPVVVMAPLMDGVVIERHAFHERVAAVSVHVAFSCVQQKQKKGEFRYEKIKDKFLFDSATKDEPDNLGLRDQLGTYDIFKSALTWRKDMESLNIYSTFMNDELEEKWDVLHATAKENEVIIRNQREMLTAILRLADAHSAFTLKEVVTAALLFTVPLVDESLHGPFLFSRRRSDLIDLLEAPEDATLNKRGASAPKASGPKSKAKCGSDEPAKRRRTESAKKILSQKLFDDAAALEVKFVNAYGDTRQATIVDLGIMCILGPMQGLAMTQLNKGNIQSSLVLFFRYLITFWILQRV